MADSQHGAILEALKRGDVVQAEAQCEAFLSAGGGAEGIYLMGAIQSLKGDKQSALRLIGRAATLLPNRADIAYNHGVTLRESGRIGDAAAEWKRAIALDPNHRDASANLALALDHSGDASAAVEAYRRLLDRWPDDRDGLYNFANLCQRAGQFDAARNLYSRLLDKHAGFAAGWINFGMLQKRQRDWAGSERSYRRAVEIDPGSAAAHFNLANLLLQQGQWREGWAEYEWRLSLPDETPPRIPLPKWTGSEPTGTRVLLWGDQGYGDAIQFLRFAGAVAARGHHAFVVVKPELRGLAATAPGIEAAFAPGDKIPEADTQAALASLPHLLGIDDVGKLWTGPYLRAEVSVPIAPRIGRHVGLVWAGDPRHPNDSHRSARLDDLAPLADVAGVTWHSLQLGPARDQLAASKWAAPIVDESPRLTDFAASAAFVSSLDLVVTVDTSMAHLVGSLGRPGIVMLPHVDCDWRWLAEGDSTPWYPTLRLVRQERPRDWTSVAGAIAAMLAAIAK